ncbi:unnamed protein product [Cuscuta campestris]|uniref:Ubiquitin-like protease family profile domain-containing protein n=1 Tax=Cuscuta campestris TaxID=132261 RepID=A0A484KY73_9ASTE|nr:unnamed protein product [Cuscuta campestris]
MASSLLLILISLFAIVSLSILFEFLSNSYSLLEYHLWLQKMTDEEDTRSDEIADEDKRLATKQMAKRPKHNRDDPAVESDDVVKLALLHLLGNVMFGHQPCVTFSIRYINLVDDLDAFNKFTWGEDIWEELLTHAGRCAQSLKARGRGKVTFGGFVFALQESQWKVLKMILEQLERQKGDDTEERGFKKIDDEIVNENENVESEDMENKNMGKDTILEQDGTDHEDVGKDATSKHDDTDLGHVDTTVSNEGDDKIKEDIPVGKRQTKEPQKLSLSGRKVPKKTQKMKEAVKSKFEVTLSQMEVVIGPFSLHPKARTGVRKIYTKGDENMTKKPIILDKFIISSKTWLYDLFMDQEWLDTLKVCFPMGPIRFCLYAPEYWGTLGAASAAVESKIVWVYNSKGGRSLKEIAEYSTCIKCLLPKLMDLCDVYINHPTGPMGDNKLHLKAVDFCPQQTDAGNCGMFVLKIVEYLMMDMDIKDIRTDDMAAYRMKMATELVRFAESNMAAKE